MRSLVERGVRQGCDACGCRDRDGGDERDVPGEGRGDLLAGGVIYRKGRKTGALTG